jgi:aerobic carbon-monoxide dehydrogenase large subunit
MTTTSPSVAPFSAIGDGVGRLEDARLLAGQGRYVADVQLPGMAHVAIVRSEVPHAVIKGVDLSAARAVEGVIDAFSAADVEPYMKPIPSRGPLPPSLLPVVQYPFARDRARYVGEPVAVVVAETKYVAEDAASLVTIDYEVLTAVGSVEAALAPDAPTLFADVSNVAHTLEKEAGDVEAAKAAAALVVEERFRVHRHTAVPLETRGLVAAFDPATEVLSVWGPTKVPHHNRRELARMLDVPVEQIRYCATDVGGGFGVRGEFYAEDLLVPLAALRTRRPVQWIEDRREHLLGTNHSREGEWQISAAFDADGTLVAIDAELTMDFGAYARTAGANVALYAVFALPGPYRVPNFRCRARSVLTNKMGIGTVRSPGGYEASFARERTLDIAAERLGIDRIELRRRNLLSAEAMPHDTGIPSGPATMVYDGGDYRATFDVVVEAIDDEALQRARSDAQASGRLVGIGFACCNEGTGGGGFEAARVRREPDGSFTVFVGTTSMGQGHRTALAQIAADALGVGYDQIDVVQGDTDLVPEGIGTFASRTMIYSGGAVWLAATDLRAELEQPDADLDAPHEVTREFHSDAEVFPHAASAAIVEIDPELGQLRILRYVVAAEVGTVINPNLVRGQLAGAAVFGIGGALLEELVYADNGTPLSTSFMDYLLPSSVDVPTVETIIMPADPSTENPLGVRGAGEIGTTGTAAALANAVADALGSADAIMSLPIKPQAIVAQRLGV